MSWLSEEDIAWLKSNQAPATSTLEKWNHAGAYFRSFGAPESGMLEVAYHAITPGQSFSITMMTPDDYDGDAENRTFHGTSLAGASLIIGGGFKTSYGAWSGEQLLKIAPYPGIPTVYTTPHWETSLRYQGNVNASSIDTGPVGFVVLECFCDKEKRIGVIKRKGTNVQWLFHPRSLVVHKFHFICTAAARDRSILERMELDADERTSQLSAKKRRSLATLFRKAQAHLAAWHNKAVPARIIRPPRIGKMMKKTMWKEQHKRRKAMKRLASAQSR